MNYFEDPVEYDEATGLPKLPEGYFWKVSKASLDGYHNVAIRKVWLCYPFSTRVEYTLTSNLTKKSLKTEAEYVFRNFEKKLRNAKTAKSLYGSYPPKKLK